MKEETMEVKITSSKENILKIKRVLAWMHWNTRWGHSGTIVTDMDGDGGDAVTVEGFDLNEHKEKAAKPTARPRKFVEWMGAED